MNLDTWIRTHLTEAVIARILLTVGILLAGLGLVALIQTLWKKRSLKDPSAYAVAVIVAIGIALAGFGGYTIRHPQQTAEGGAESEELNSGEMKQLLIAPLQREDDSPAPVGKWPQWRGPNRDGNSSETGLQTDWDAHPPRVLWSRPLGRGYSSIALADGRLYTMYDEPDKEHIVCLDAETGADRWSLVYPVRNGSIQAQYAGSRATPTVFDGRIYTVGVTGILHCLEAEAGASKAKLLWRHDLVADFDAPVPVWGFAGSPLIEGDLVYVFPGGKKGTVAAFDRRTGALRWSALNDSVGFSSPIAATLAGVRQIVCFTGKGLAGLAPADGRKLWYYPWSTSYDANIATPIIAGDYVFISSDYNAGCALLHIRNASEGMRAEPVYVKHNKLMRNHHSSCVLHDRYLFGFDAGPGMLRCIDFRAGTECWSERNIPKGSFIWAQGHLIILAEDGTLMLVEASPDGFHFKGQLQVFSTGNDCWALPALANGKLYVRDKQQIVCLDLRQ